MTTPSLQAPSQSATSQPALPLEANTLATAEAPHAAAYAVIVVERDGRCRYSPNLPELVDAYPWERCWEADGMRRVREAFIDACMFRRRRQDVDASLRIGTRCYEFGLWLDPTGDDLVIGRLVRRFGESLSPREREVLALVAGGAPNARIAKLLGTSEATIRSHLKSMRDKLGVTRNEGLLLAAAGAATRPAAG